MKFYSTQGRAESVTFSKAIMEGLAPDGGLYMPESLPRLLEDLVVSMQDMSCAEIGEHALIHFIDEMTGEELAHICRDAFSFPLEIVDVEDGISVLELFHGPTLSFKDFGARFLARAMALYRRGADKELTVLTATSGDTGSAVADGFDGVSGVRVVVLYPKGRISSLQEHQIATRGENVTACAVEGSFDDCQRMVKDAFADDELRQQVQLTSANSINIGRLLPQMLYYFYGATRLARTGSVDVVVPSGNFGNITAGCFARAMGAPIHALTAATNENDVVPKFLQTGNYQSQPTRYTYSSAMDVGDPSNIARLRALYGNSIAQQISAHAVSDADTLNIMTEVHERTGYTMDPHTAVGYAVARKICSPERRAVVLSTAHPAKFPDTLQEALGAVPPAPRRLQSAMKKELRTVRLPARTRSLKELLLAL